MTLTLRHRYWINPRKDSSMCKVCQDAMDAVTDKGDGATPYAWDRADAAIKAWRATLDESTEFEDVNDECQAWCDHMERTPP